MIIKARTESLELKLMRSLYVRMNLLEKDQNHYFNLEKGYKGELLFDNWLERKLFNERLILNDLLLECNHNVFQIDSLVITSEAAFLFEVKNFEGDFYMEADKFYTYLKKEISSPLLQLERSESLLRRLFQEHSFNTPIKAYVVFVNPEFYLYKTPLNSPIIFPTQLNRFLENLNIKSSYMKAWHSKLAEKLIVLQKDEYPYKRLPKFSYEQLEKGVICKFCYSFISKSKGSKVICHKCGKTENMNEAILRTVEEYMLLFPNRKVTSSNIYEWCKGIRSMSTFTRFLNGYYTPNGKGKASFYVKTKMNDD